MDGIFNLLKSNDIELALIELENNGYYNSDLKTIFINQNLNEKRQKEVILHELGHALNHKEFSPLYSRSSFKLKMENEANSFMMNNLIEESEGHFNYSDVLETFKLGLGWDFKIK
ncbi:ImmA/IrrE family metallo-endopeptidase [Carnobacterium sp. TMP28]|uniref:ImmA/IrrE family metallo-endopeptidase n=1 Tax=Carnobacterium sp. TMP28 TaxID=3397060 RepID=UPI0039DFF416